MPVAVLSAQHTGTGSGQAILINQYCENSLHIQSVMVLRHVHMWLPEHLQGDRVTGSGEGDGNMVTAIYSM